ncbi:MAG: hypothetical protein L3J69_10910, partial [Desulfobacula sp.]|nr:hypothetical protein [Desulfobacula sp.]
MPSLQDSQKIFLNGESLKDTGFLSQIADPNLSTAVHGQFGDFLPIKMNIARFRSNHPHDHAKAGGLSRAVGTEQTNNF